MSGIRLLPLLVFVPLSSVLAADADDAKQLQGVWKGWVVEGKGDDPKQQRIRIELTIKGNTISAIENGTKDLGMGTFSIKDTKEGKQLDATRTKGTGSPMGATYLGICSIEGNTLKWCVGNPPGKTRPTELRSKTGQFLMVLTKEK